MKKIIALFLVIVLCILSLTGCRNGNSQNQSQAQTQSQPNQAAKITFVLDWLPNTNHTGLYVALKKGYFEEAGLEVDIQQPPEDGAEALVASGKAQFGVSFQENIGMMLDSDSPMPITTVAAIIQHNTSGIISLKSTGITSPKGLEGRTYATWDLPVEKAILKDVVTKDGGDFSKVKMVPTTVTDVITALNTNIDAVWVYYAWDGVAAKVKGIDFNFFAFKDINPALDFYTPIIIANDEYLQQNPDTAKAFLNAVRQGYEFAAENPEEAAEILCEAVPEIDIQIAIESQKYLAEQYIAGASRWGEIDLQRWDTFFNWLYENKIIDKQIPSGKGFTNDYLN